MRALLVMNPMATSTTERAKDVIVGALAAGLETEVAHTAYRGHAVQLAQKGVQEGFDVVVAFGGDGTVNEVVNGLLADGPSPDLPLLAVVPGGSTNVFARALGLPNDAVEATGVLLEALRAGRRRGVSMGQADERYFTFAAGIGFDAAVVGLVEERRAEGKRSTGGLYIRSALRHYGRIDRRHAPINLDCPSAPERCDTPLFMAVIANTSPWTYLGHRAINPTPEASFDGGLDLWGISAMGPFSITKHVSRLLTDSKRLTTGRGTVSVHDMPELTVTAPDPVDLQLDGDYLGKVASITFRTVPDALRVVL